MIITWHRCHIHTICMGGFVVFILNDESIRIGFSEQTGAIMRLEDLARAQVYIDISDERDQRYAAIRIHLGDGMREFPGAFAGASTTPTGIELIFSCEQGIVVTCKARISGGKVYFSFSATNSGSAVIHAIEYPVFPGLHRIAGQGKDFLAHPYATGVLLKDPLMHLNHDGAGLRFMPYPESFSGASMQFFTYYGVGKGGLYFASHDANMHLKWLNFYHMHWCLEASHIRGNEDMRPGNGLEMDYEFVVAPTPGNDWYEAADIYRKWATAQHWCAKGRLFDLPDDQKSRWLLEKVGLCTFGINAMHDRTAWLKRYHDDLRTPIFHVLGPDWTREPQTFGYGVPGGYHDWVPTRFSKANLDAIRCQGDYFAPFEFDFLVDLGKDDSDNLERNLMHFPKDGMSFDDYHFQILCPHTRYTKDLHRERDLQIHREAAVDSMYYDISANNLMMACTDERHGHPVGGTAQINQGFKDVYQDTKRALQAQASKYVPIGTELMNEIFINDLDYYQARSWGQPSSSLEFWPIRCHILSGAAEVIPMFSYVYSGYGPLRMDGWGKLVEETDEFFHHVVARVYLWGALYEINHEYSPMEALNGKINASSEHYFHFPEVDYAYSPGRAAYLAEYAALRVGRANRYLAYGRMLSPPCIDAKLVEMPYYHYNHAENDSSYDTRGAARVPDVLVSAWQAPVGGSWAVLLANTTGSERVVSISIDKRKYGMDGTYEAMAYDRFEPTEEIPGQSLGIHAGDEIRLNVTLPARSPHMIEFFEIKSE